MSESTTTTVVPETPRKDGFRTPSRSLGGRMLSLVLGGMLVTALALPVLLDALSLRVDMTRDRTNGVAGVTRIALWKRDPRRQASRVDFVFSDERSLPPEMRAPHRRAWQLAQEFEREVGRIRLGRTRVEDLSNTERSALAREGIAPIAVTSTTDLLYSSSQITAPSATCAPSSDVQATRIARSSLAVARGTSTSSGGVATSAT